MPVNRHALIRYHALDKCFSNPYRKYNINALLVACNEALQSIDGKTEGIKRRQLFDDIKFMENDEPYGIELVREKDGREVYYKYKDPKFSIKNSALDDKETKKIKDALHVLSKFQGLPQFEWIDEIIAKFESGFVLKKGAEKIVAFDENKEYLATKHIKPLFNAILNKQPLKISYQSFNRTEPRDIIFHPYFLKQYNNRWFCLGMCKDYNPPTNLALDRMIDIQKSRQKFVPNKNINFEEHFEDVVGVTVQGDIQKITIKVTKEHWPYIASKPLHGSQKIKLKGDEFVIISIEVKPNYELESLLMSHGNDLEVMEPKSFKDSLVKRIKPRNL